MLENVNLFCNNFHIFSNAIAKSCDQNWEPSQTFWDILKPFKMSYFRENIFFMLWLVSLQSILCTLTGLKKAQTSFFVKFILNIKSGFLFDQTPTCKPISASKKSYFTSYRWKMLGLEIYIWLRCTETFTS